MEHKKTAVQTGIFAAGFIMLLSFTVMAGCAPSDKKIEETLVLIAAEANKGLPVMVDAHTRLDEISALPGKKIRYSNTLVNNLAQEIDIEFFKESVGRTLAATVKNNPALENFRKKRVTFVYSYVDKTGAEVAVFEYTPEDYK